MADKVYYVIVLETEPIYENIKFTVYNSSKIKYKKRNVYIKYYKQTVYAAAYCVLFS